MTLPWLDKPVQLHSSIADTCKLTAAQCAYWSGHWRYCYQADHVYGHATIYFMCAVIRVFAAGHITSRIFLRSKSRPSFEQSVATYHAIARYSAYKSFNLAGLRWYSPPIGVMVLGVIGAIYFFALTMGPKPYYWPNTMTTSFGGSPPIATRSGWMAVALLPFVMVLASKANYVTLLTGISHEKLQVFHRWTSWAMFVLALVHTFPFIVYNIKMGDMLEEWNSSVVYWTGVAAIIPQAYLNVMSVGPIRNRYYEFFKSTHYLAIILFVFFFFIYCDFRLSSWDYFIAALSLYFSTLLFSLFRTLKTSFRARASLQVLNDTTIRIVIPTNSTWKSGQHVFLRFPTLGIHSLTSHPFTVCSLPSSGNMISYVRPAGGFTAHLRRIAESRKGASIPVWIDGPYGNSQLADKLSRYDKVLLVAGGSGAGFLLPLLESISEDRSSTSDVNIVLVARYLYGSY